MKVHIRNDSNCSSFLVRPHECSLRSDSSYYKITEGIIEDNKINSDEFGSVFERILSRDNICDCVNDFIGQNVSTKEITKEEFNLIKTYGELVHK